MPVAVVETPINRQEALGQFLTATPVADFMASMFGPLPSGTRRTPRDRRGLLVKDIIDTFRTRWALGAEIISIRNPKRNLVHLNSEALATLGITLDSAAKPPDVIIHDASENRLFLIEAVTHSGPVDGKRRQELHALFAACNAHLIFVTAFENRRTMQKFIPRIAWESEVWIAENPDHMIHFNGERFLGPYPDVMPAKP